jgi:group I intron endonuclease
MSDMFIYKFTHIETNRSYIGQTVQNPNQRRLEHISHSRHSPKEYHFHNALRKYGIDSFTFEVIATAHTLEELNLLEEKYVNQYDSINNGFNIRQPGGNKLHSEKSKERMSIAQCAAHAKRREKGTEGGWKRRDGGGMKGKVHPNKGGTTSLKGTRKTLEEREKMRTVMQKFAAGKTWKLVNGVRVWCEKEASA